MNLWPRYNVTVPQSKKWLKRKPHWPKPLPSPVYTSTEGRRDNCGYNYGKTNEADYRVDHSYHPQC